jgi:2'-5' RNA ligase
MDIEPDMFGHRPSPVEHRSYFAIYPEPAIAQRIEHEARVLGRQHNVRRVVPAGRLHLSLNGLQRGPELEPHQLEEALLAGDTIRRPAFDLVLDRIQTWDNGRSGRRGPVPTVLNCSAPPREALALYEDLRRQIRLAGLRVGGHQFNPHITLWYAPARLPALALRHPVHIRVNRFCLVHSIAGAGRPKHLASWPLKF